MIADDLTLRCDVAGGKRSLLRVLTLMLKLFTQRWNRYIILAKKGFAALSCQFCLSSCVNQEIIVLKRLALGKHDHRLPGHRTSIIEHVFMPSSCSHLGEDG